MMFPKACRRWWGLWILVSIRWCNVTIFATPPHSLALPKNVKTSVIVIPSGIYDIESDKLHQWNNKKSLDNFLNPRNTMRQFAMIDMEVCRRRSAGATSDAFQLKTSSRRSHENIPHYLAVQNERFVWQRTSSETWFVAHASEFPGFVTLEVWISQPTEKSDRNAVWFMDVETFDAKECSPLLVNHLGSTTSAWRFNADSDVILNNKEASIVETTTEKKMDADAKMPGFPATPHLPLRFPGSVVESPMTKKSTNKEFFAASTPKAMPSRPKKPENRISSRLGAYSAPVVKLRWGYARN